MVDGRFDRIDGCLGRLDGKIDEISDRLDDLDGHPDALGAEPIDEIGAVRTAVDAAIPDAKVIARRAADELDEDRSLANPSERRGRP